MKTRFLNLAIAITLILFAVSCKKDDVKMDTNKSENHNKGMIVLGKKLENPYSLKNMRKALANLQGLKSSTTNSDILSIEATDLYVRALPDIEPEYSSLEAIPAVELYDYPLDYEILVQGDYYHDPEIPEDLYTWQYFAIRISDATTGLSELANASVTYEILDSLFIPENAAYLKRGDNTYKDFLNKLEDEALRITGNLPQGGIKNSPVSTNDWTPSGTIRAWDDVIKGYISLEGVKVRARRWFTTHVGFTNANGYFTTQGFRYEANYSIAWESDVYDIRNGWFLQAYYNGPKQSTPWNLDISSGGETIKYATIHRAAFKCFYGDNLNLFRPFLMYGGKTKICYIDKIGTGVFWGDWSATGILPDIKIWGKNTNGDKHTEQVFGTTCHELAHQAHSQHLGNIQYWQVSKIIYESWADAAEWGLSNDEYHKLGNTYNNQAAKDYNHIYNNHDYWPVYHDHDYSPIFIDLVDNVNQRTTLVNGYLYPNDNVTGYVLSPIARIILPDSYGLTSLKEAVKNNKPAGVTDEAIDELFALY